MYVIIVGGGKVGFNLAKELLRDGYEVLLIEKDKNRWAMLERVLGEAVFLGDGCEMRTLQEVGCARADVVVAVTGHDEDNLTICQLAKRKFNVPRVIARVNMPQNEAVLKALGVDDTICGTRIIYHLIKQEIEVNQIHLLATLKGGGLDIVEINVYDNSPVVGKSLKDITFPPRCLVLSILRGSEVIVPSGQTIIEKGDKIISVIDHDQVEELKNLLVSKRE
ncbi:TrkA family potassium uptake protein [bacterium]|nr:TrkA family potassium uptake protein [bacterium]